MPIAEYDTMSAVTVSTTDISIITGTTTPASDTTDGAVQVWIDTTNIAKGDEFQVSLYEKVIGSGSQRFVEAWSLLGVQSKAMVLDLPMVMHGWDVRIKKIAGTDRAFDASVRYAS